MRDVDIVILIGIVIMVLMLMGMIIYIYKDGGQCMIDPLVYYSEQTGLECSCYDPNSIGMNSLLPTTP